MRQFGSGFTDTLAQIEGPYMDGNSFGSAFAGGRGLHLSDLMGPVENGFGQMPELTQMEGPFEFGRRKSRARKARSSRKGRKGGRRSKRSRRCGSKRLSKALIRRIKKEISMAKKGKCRTKSRRLKRCSKTQRKRISKLKKLLKL